MANLITLARFVATDIVFLGIVVMGLIAFLFDALMRQGERLLVPWKRKAQGAVPGRLP